MQYKLDFTAGLEVVQFKWCKMILDRKNRVVRTVFKDDAYAETSPCDSPEYRAHAVDKTGTEDTLLYCWQHDMMHVVWSEMFGQVSLVLWNVAHGLPIDSAGCQLEEIEVQKLHKALRLPVTVTRALSAAG